MIIVKLMGGLGNQLFQYAAGKALAEKHKTALKLDLIFLEADSEQHSKRDFALDLFDLDYEICSPAERAVFYRDSLLNRILPIPFKRNYLAIENSFHFDPAFFSFPENTYLNGFWQSEKYFLPVRELLLQGTIIRAEMPAKAEEAKKAILGSNSVSLHVRRGDYVSNKNAQAYHGNLGADYYVKALDYLKAMQKDLKIFVFSDDIEWVRSNLNLSAGEEYIDFNTGRNSVFDLHLMSLCRHNIIANSSFSWWGAWLNQNKQKKVIAPQSWFANRQIETKDLLPANWIKI